jgi:predicted AlkP superfamily phosphohydrolase/phosphomutase
MLSAEARNAKIPLAKRRRTSDDLVELGEALGELVDVWVGGAVASFTPPVTGPLSVSCITGRTPLARCATQKIGSDARALHLYRCPSQPTRTRQGNLV